MDFEEYKYMYLYMYKEFIMNYDSFESLIKKHQKEMKKVKNKATINFKDYWSFKIKYDYHYMELNKIIGDFADNSISYKKLTSNKYRQLFNLNLSEKTQDFQTLLNEINKQRDWTSHFTISYGRNLKDEQIQLLNDKDELLINKPSTISIAFFEDLLSSNERALNLNLKPVKDYIHEDSKAIFQKNIKLRRTSLPLNENAALEGSYKSYLYSKDRKKRNAKK